jgi:hypothetical protein
MSIGRFLKMKLASAIGLVPSIFQGPSQRKIDPGTGVSTWNESARSSQTDAVRRGTGFGEELLPSGSGNPNERR